MAMNAKLQDIPQQVKRFLQSRGLVSRQENGQRIIYPIKNIDENMDFPRGSEVFIGRIPRDVFEDELLPLFERAGLVYKFRLMMDFSGSNRGFGFAQYTTRAAALNAINLLDQYELRPNNFIGVVESLDNCRLFLGNLPPNISQDAIQQELSKVTTGVKQVIVPNVNQKPEKLHAFVEYENHRSATMARRYLVPGDHIMFGRKIEVDWAKPEAVHDNKALKSGTLFIGNINHRLSTEFLQLVLSLKGFYPLSKLERVTSTSIFVTYKERQHASDMFESIKYYNEPFNRMAEDPNSPIRATWGTQDALATMVPTSSQLVKIDPIDKTVIMSSPISSISSSSSSKLAPLSSSSSSSLTSSLTSSSQTSPLGSCTPFINFFDNSQNHGFGHFLLSQ